MMVESVEQVIAVEGCLMTKPEEPPKAKELARVRPRIGVSWVTLGQHKSERYLEAVRLSGGDPVALAPNAESWDAELATISGLLLTGGGDVDPTLYGEPNVACRGVSAQRDRLEATALSSCMRRRLPILAICRGFQFVNVALGGSLIQDIQSTVVHGTLGDESSFHDVDIAPATQLARYAGVSGGVTVNSRHHQGVDSPRASPKLRVSAVAPDGIVEGLELPDYPFFVAVQCHPEYLEQAPHLRGLFGALVEEAERSRS